MSSKRKHTRPAKNVKPSAQPRAGRASSKAGLPPGSLVHVGIRKANETIVTVTTYDKDHHDRQVVGKLEDAFELSQRTGVTWINVDGLHDTDLLGKLGQHFDLHTMMLEDALNTNQRPKFEDFDKNLFFVLKMVTYDQAHQLDIEQVSLILGKDLVISLQEKPGDVFTAVRERLAEKKGRIRDMGAEYLIYSLVDAVVDHYFFALETLGDEMTTTEDSMMSRPNTDSLRTIHQQRRALLRIRKAVWPLRDAVSFLERGDSDLIPDFMRIYFRDVYEHTVQVLDTVETSREVLSSLHDMYLSIASNRMNEIMKVLTVFASVFIPLTFVAGVYGMNFDVMPELHWRFGYAAVWLIMIGVAVSMFAYFRRKKWF